MWHTKDWGSNVGMNWGSVKNSEGPCVFCTVPIQGAKPPLYVQYKIHSRPPRVFDTPSSHSNFNPNSNSNSNLNSKIKNKKHFLIFHRPTSLGQHSEFAEHGSIQLSSGSLGSSSLAMLCEAANHKIPAPLGQQVRNVGLFSCRPVKIKESFKFFIWEF